MGNTNQSPSLPPPCTKLGDTSSQFKSILTPISTSEQNRPNLILPPPPPPRDAIVYSGSLSGQHG
jgi:hypothetical protein